MKTPKNLNTVILNVIAKSKSSDWLGRRTETRLGITGSITRGAKSGSYWQEIYDAVGKQGDRLIDDGVIICTCRPANGNYLYVLPKKTERVLRALAEATA